MLSLAAATADQGQQTIFTFVMFGALLLFFYFFIIRPQKKQQKKTQEMLSTIKVGTVVTTKGGIIGKVINIKEDDLTIESGVDGTKLLIKRLAVGDVQNEIEA